MHRKRGGERERDRQSEDEPNRRSDRIATIRREKNICINVLRLSDNASFRWFFFQFFFLPCLLQPRRWFSCVASTCGWHRETVCGGLRASMKRQCTFPSMIQILHSTKKKRKTNDQRTTERTNRTMERKKTRNRETNYKYKNSELIFDFRWKINDEEWNDLYINASVSMFRIGALRFIAK